MAKTTGRILLAILCAAGGALALSGTWSRTSAPVTIGEASAASAPGACARLKDLALPSDLRIETAEDVTPDPKWPFPPSPFNFLAGPNPGVSQTPFCRVVGVIETEISFELWLPKDWNGRFMGVGNGGYSGAINYPSMGQGLAKGFAVASTDTGHKTPLNMFDAAWVPGHPQRVIDFGHRAHHLMAEVSKKLIASYYGQPAKYAYFNGCSSGGWQGFAEAQKYPGDYDGVIAGAPAFNFVKLQTRGLWLAQEAAKDPAGALSPAQGKLLVDAALARCDAEDGVKDGVMDPQRCDFDPVQLQCKGAAGDDCLTAAQVARARLVYGPAKTGGGMSLYPGSAYGAPAALDVSSPAGSGQPMVNLVLAGSDLESVLTPQTFDADRDVPRLESRIGGDLSSYDPNLKPFMDRGGKVIMYHGWEDPLLSPYNSIVYYEAVRAGLGGKKTDSFYRLFMIPGMGHCAGGPGTDTFDAIGVIQAWVEKGQAPKALQAAHLTAGKPDRTRPLCPYPRVAVYSGKGSTDDAKNFACKAP